MNNGTTYLFIFPNVDIRNSIFNQYVALCVLRAVTLYNDLKIKYHNRIMGI